MEGNKSNLCPSSSSSSASYLNRVTPPMGPASHCIFCLGSTAESADTPPQSDSYSTRRALSFLERHLSLGPGSGPNNQDYCNYNVCRSCISGLEAFSTLYEDIKGLELKLEGEVFKLRQVMEYANRVPARKTFVTQCYQEERGLLCFPGMEEMYTWRRTVSKRCLKKLSSNFPKVVIPKLELCMMMNEEDDATRFAAGETFIVSDNRGVGGFDFNDVEIDIKYEIPSSPPPHSTPADEDDDNSDGGVANSPSNASPPNDEDFIPEGKIKKIGDGRGGQDSNKNSTDKSSKTANATLDLTPTPTPPTTSTSSTPSSKKRNNPSHVVNKIGKQEQQQKNQQDCNDGSKISTQKNPPEHKITTLSTFQTVTRSVVEVGEEVCSNKDPPPPPPRRVSKRCLNKLSTNFSKMVIPKLVLGDTNEEEDTTRFAAGGGETEAFIVSDSRGDNSFDFNDTDIDIKYEIASPHPPPPPQFSQGANDKIADVAHSPSSASSSNHLDLIPDTSVKKKKKRLKIKTIDTQIDIKYEIPSSPPYSPQAAPENHNTYEAGSPSNTSNEQDFIPEGKEVAGGSGRGQQQDSNSNNNNIASSSSSSPPSKRKKKNLSRRRRVKKISQQQKNQGQSSCHINKKIAPNPQQSGGDTTTPFRPAQLQHQQALASGKRSSGHILQDKLKRSIKRRLENIRTTIAHHAQQQQQQRPQHDHVQQQEGQQEHQQEPKNCTHHPRYSR